MSLWRAYSAAGSIALCAYAAIPNEKVNDVFFVFVGLLCVAGTAVGIARNKPRVPMSWWWLAGATLLWVLADAVSNFYDFSTGAVPFPSYADGLYLFGYVAFGVGLVILVSGTWRVEFLGHIINSLILMTGFGLITYVFVLKPGVPSPLGIEDRLVSGFYPVADVFLLGLLAQVAGTQKWRTGSYQLLVASVVLMIATDLVSNIRNATSGQEDSILLDLGWLASYILLAAAAAHPTMSRLSSVVYDGTVDIRTSLGANRIALMTAVTLTPAAVMAWELCAGRPVSEWGWAVSVGAMILVLLVLIRVVSLLRLLQQQSDALHKVAETDDLTGLANRRALHLGLRVALAQEPAVPTGLLILDLDRFKLVNDTFGLAVGDDVLREVSQRLVAAAEPGDLVSRLGNDEFAMLLSEDSENAVSRAMNLLDALRVPVRIRHITLHVEASVGIAVSSAESAATAETLVLRADLAMHAAKTVQPRFAVYSPSMDQDRHQQLILLAELAAALKDRQLEVFYQPKVELASGAMVGVEALLRWHHPSAGILSPDAFLPIAEQTGLMRQLTHYVIDTAVAQCQSWSKKGFDLDVAVNLSTRSLLDETLTDFVREILTRYQVDGRRLTLEITETSAMTEPARAIAVLSELRELGVMLAIDDYGTGYSSLAYLQSLPVHQLKIDKTFVTTMTADSAHATIVRSTIELARNLGLTVTAEGVENAETYAALRKLKCHTAQGYFLGRPAPADQMTGMVDEISRLVGSSARAIKPMQAGLP